MSDNESDLDLESDNESAVNESDNNSESESDIDLDDDEDNNKNKRKNNDKNKNKKDLQLNKKKKVETKVETKVSGLSTKSLTVVKPISNTNNNNNNNNKEVVMHSKNPPEILLPSNTITSTSENVVSDISRGPPVATDAAARKLILQYLRQQNRPYSALQIFDNLHKRVQKPSVERILGQLSDETGKDSNDLDVLCKEYGKAKIYYCNQLKLEATLGNNGLSLEELEGTVNNLQKQVDTLQSNQNHLKKLVTDLQNQPTDEELDKKLLEIENIVTTKKNKLSTLTTTKLDPNAMKNIINLHNKYRTEWVQRKTKCKDALEQLSDGMGKSVKIISTEIGIETDEDVNAILPKPLSDIIT